MAHRISRGSRQELVGAIVERYRTGSRSDKRRILTEFVAVTGYHRKHAIRILNGGATAWSQATRFRRPRVYEEAVQQALVVLWEAADRICGKRLKALCSRANFASKHIGATSSHKAFAKSINASTIFSPLRSSSCFTDRLGEG